MRACQRGVARNHLPHCLYLMLVVCVSLSANFPLYPLIYTLVISSFKFCLKLAAIFTEMVKDMGPKLRERKDAGSRNLGPALFNIPASPGLQA